MPALNQTSFTIKLAALVSLFVLQACNPVVPYFYGVRKPKVKTKSELLRYLVKHDMDTTNQYGLNYEAYLYRMIENRSSPVRVELFDSNGLLIIPADDRIQNCSGRISDYLSVLYDTNTYISTDSIKVEKYLEGLTTLDGVPLNINYEGYDILAVINWCTFAGSLNKKVMPWQLKLENVDSLKVKIIKVNLDYRDFWGETNLR